MTDKRWKKRERQVAKFFGCRRNPLSGGNAGHSRSDSLHEILYIEQKDRERHAVINLWRGAKELADKENKIPVVTLSEKGKKGFWVMCHSSDLVAVANQRRIAKNKESNGEIELPMKIKIF